MGNNWFNMGKKTQCGFSILFTSFPHMESQTLGSGPWNAPFCLDPPDLVDLHA